MPPSRPRIRQIARSVEKWFATNQRELPWRPAYDPYHVWLSEVMAQQTRIEVVLPFFRRFVARFPTIEALAAASPDDVAACWSGLGYYRRVKMLHAGARRVVRDQGGRLPNSAAELQKIEGIGRYTAGAIASIAFEKRAPIVDGNVARVAARLQGIEHPLGSTALMNAAWSFAGDLAEACASPRELNQGLMELGAIVCKPTNPECGACPLKNNCDAYATERVSVLPAKRPAVQKRRLRIPLYLIRDPHGRILMRRETGRLMTSLFHLPHGERSLLTGDTLPVRRGASLGSFLHTVTTRHVHFELFTASLRDEIRDGAGEYAWIEPAEIHTIPHPSYVAKALRLAKA